ncbi:FKBP-type peptidyl-prolyl cis-trans isomerase [Maribellus mangrovi]|uniref:FKBP-type peptidyl-prolyl cis-trans isomerase n=1 Tax=Maribellus mangrovi TaxID=3133146 RepID=UPI0030EC14B7
MINILKNFSVLLVLPIILFMGSCVDGTTSDRTQEEELVELNQLILNMESQGIDVDTTESGVYYVIHKQGSGPFIAPYDTITIGYEAYLTNGMLFDTSEDRYEDGEWEFVYMQQTLMQGLTDGLAIMKKGSEFEFIIPSRLAYGDFGQPPLIGPYESLIIGVKVYDIKPLVE